MWYILDGLIIVIILLFVFLSVKKGFTRSLIEALGLIIAIFISFTFSGPIADFVYDEAVEPSVIKTVETTVNDTTSTAKDAVDSIWNKMPVYITESNFLDLSKDQVIDSIDNSVKNETNEIAKNISVTFVKPISTKILSVVISTIIVIVLLFAIGFLARYFNKVIDDSAVGDINKIFGGILGLVKGTAFSIILCLIISTVLQFTKNGFWIITPETINSTYIFKFLMEFSPFI